MADWSPRHVLNGVPTGIRTPVTAVKGLTCTLIAINIYRACGRLVDGLKVNPRTPVLHMSGGEVGVLFGRCVVGMSCEFLNRSQRCS